MINDMAFFSECGSRDVNQDAIYVSAEGNRGIFAVADGMGGHSGGEVASSAVVNGIRDWWDGSGLAEAETEIDSVAEQCTSLLANINAEVFSYFSVRGQVGGSTVAVLIIWDDRYAILSAGDSRIYQIRQKALRQLTTDDVWENLPEVKREMREESMACDPRFGRLTEALGSEKRLRVSRGGGMLFGREVFLLCSDGVHKYCAHRELERILRRGVTFRSADRMKKMIRQRAIKNGVDDNYSAVICRVKY